MNKTVGELLRAVIDLHNNVTKTLTDLFKQLYDAYNSKILPSLKESFNQIAEEGTKLYDEIVSAAVEVLHRVVESLKKFEGDFKKIGKTVSESFTKFSKLVSEAVTSLQKELVEFRKLVSDYIKSLPGLESLKEKFDEVSVFFVSYFHCFKFLLWTQFQ